jgi:hypothetical protein
MGCTKSIRWCSTEKSNTLCVINKGGSWPRRYLPSVRLGEPRRASFRRGRPSPASEGVHFLGRISPISPEIPQISQIRIVRGWIGWHAHLLYQVSSLIISIYYYVTPGRVKMGVQQGGVQPLTKFSWLTRPYFPPGLNANNHKYIQANNRKRFGSIRADMR